MLGMKLLDVERVDWLLDLSRGCRDGEAVGVVVGALDGTWVGDVVGDVVGDLLPNTQSGGALQVCNVVARDRLEWIAVLARCA